MAKKAEGRTVPVGEALRHRVTRTVYEELPTDYPGTSLKVEKGTRPELSLRDRGRLVRAAATFYGRKAILSAASEVQDRRAGLIKHIAASHDGLRGVVSKRRGFVLNVFPKHTIAWDQAGLKSTLGAAYPAVVAEDLKLSLTLPVGYETSEGPLDSELAKKAVKLGFLAIEMKEEDIPTAIATEIVLRVDEPKLHGMNVNGQVDVAKTGIATETWTITTEPT